MDQHTMNCNQIINNSQVLDSKRLEGPLSRNISCAIFAEIYISFTLYLMESIRPLKVRSAQQNQLCGIITTLLSQEMTDGVSKPKP
jgi:hypothetical protein